MGETQAVGTTAPEKIHKGDVNEFKRRVSEGASIHFAALAAGFEPGWERDEDLRNAIDQLDAVNKCDAEVAVFKEIKNGKGNATMAGKYLASKAGWNEKDDLAQEIVILPKIVDGRAEPPTVGTDHAKKTAL